MLFFLVFSNSWSNLCVWKDIFFHNTPMHSFIGEVTVHTASYPSSPFLTPWLWLVCLFFSSCTARGPFTAWIAMFKTHYPTNITLDIIEKGTGKVSSKFFCFAVCLHLLDKSLPQQLWMSPVCFVSVIDFLMSPALDTAHDGVGFFLKFVVVLKIKKISNSWSNWCVGRDIFFNNTPMHSSWERSLSILLPTPISHALVVVSFFLLLLFLFIYLFFLFLFF